MRLILPRIELPPESSSLSDIGLQWAQGIVLDEAYRGARPPVGWWRGVGGTFETITGEWMY